MSQEEKKEVLLEAKILERLDHPNIIRFREVFIARKPRYTLNIVMDYADGGDLQSKLKEQKGKYVAETQILDWFTQICLSLKHIHDKKILHRDLKSQNIFLTKNGMAKLGDFGIAKCLDFTLEQVKTIVGTPYYLSPEIVMNKPYSFKSDIWSLGVILYEMMQLKLPFDATNLPMLSVKIIKGVYNPLPNCFSKDLRTLAAMLLVVDSNKRPTINEILSKIILTIGMPIIKSRIKNFLNELEYNREFSHTIIHNFVNCVIILECP
jgi:NIMA (never in mitosis gene a)-related kinase